MLNAECGMLSPFTLSLSKGESLRRSCFHKLSTNGSVFSVDTMMD
jgi:hypothetical protein